MGFVGMLFWHDLKFKKSQVKNCFRLLQNTLLSFDIISVVAPDPKIFLCIPVSAADAAAVNSKGIKTLLANDLITFFINGNPVFSNGPRSLSRNPSPFIILDISVFDNLIWAGK